ncbi:MAG: hypothetical protein O3B94_06885 [Bacteroidetes bacterium]|nr:hypothetical protein [Bacteroidota bacterium]
MNNRNLSNKVRVIHRYLSFFLAGIMFVYALSRITLTFRDKYYFKKPIVVEKTIEKGLENLPNIKGASNIEYNSETGDLSYTQMQPPKILGALEKMHKALSSKPLYFLKVFFGISLHFFFFLPIGCFSHRQMFLRKPFIILLQELY